MEVARIAFPKPRESHEVTNVYRKRPQRSKPTSKATVASTNSSYIAYCQLPTACCLLLIACWLLPTACCLLPIAYCLLRIAFCLLPMDRCIADCQYARCNVRLSCVGNLSVPGFPMLREHGHVNTLITRKSAHKCLCCASLSACIVQAV